jgi:hypothetical protein
VLLNPNLQSKASQRKSACETLTTMPHISTSLRNVFSEAHATADRLEYTAEEIKRIARLAEDLKSIIHAAKKRSKS